MSKLFVEKNEKERVYEFLMGLDEVFNTIKTQILSTKPMPNLGMAYNLVAEDERQRLILSSRRTTIDGAAFQIQWQRNNDSGDKSRDHDKPPPRCDNCGKLWHTIENCYEIIGYPETKKGSRGGKSKDKTTQRRQTHKAAHVDTNSAPLPGFSAEQ